MIRFLSFILLMTLAVVVNAQAPSNYTNINGRYRWIAGMFDSTFSIPKGTTPNLRTGGSTNPGAIFYNTTDSSVYTYTGTQWIKLRGSINPSDTTNKYVTQVYKKTGSDSIFYVKGGSHIFAFIDSVGSGGGGGGGGKIYYLNGGVSLGTFGGFTMYELGDTAVTGSAANFTRSTTGNIANFITDVNKPGLLQIPAGVWTIDAYLSETGGGSNHAQIYAAVEKWNGSTITTIATSPIEEILNGSTIDLYTWSVSIPTTTLSVTDRIIIQFYIQNTNGKTVTLYTQNGYVGEVHTTFTTGIGAINGLTAASQFLATGTSGTDFNISSVTATHTFNLPTASATNRGALSSADWTAFNNKGSVSSVATNNGTGITGGTITTTGTLAIDTALISTRLWRQKGIDSVQSNLTAGLALKLNISDTSSMLSPYLKKVDTASLSNRINLKVNISDTASMLSPYARKNFLNAGTGISYSSSTGTIANTAPDQTVAISSGTGISVTGTYPNFTITNTSPSSGGTVTSVATNNGTGITGGTITGAGTLAIDTVVISTRAWRQKGIDSVATLANTKVSSVSGTAPISSSGGTSPTISISQAGASTDGFLSSTDWNTFNNKGNGTVTSVATNTNTGITGGTITGAGTLAIDTTLISTRLWRQKGVDSVAGLLSSYVPTSRTITINGTSQDLSANRTYSVGTVTSVGSGYGLSGGAITGSGTLLVDSVTLSSYYLRRKDSLSSTNLLGYVTRTVLADSAAAIRAAAGGGSISGSGTTNYIPKFTSSTAVGDSRFFDNGTITFLGNGDVNAAPSTAILSGTGGSGTNIAGAEFRIRGGAGTGSGAGGPITFYTSAAGSAGTTANAATERMRLSAGNLLINQTASLTGLTNSVELTGAGNTDGTQQASYSVFANHGTFAANTGYFVFNKSRGTTAGSVTAVASGDRLGMIRWNGADGTAQIRAAEIYSEVDGTPGTNDMPGRIVFATTLDGASSPTERMRITSGGSIGIATTTIGSTLQVNGNAAIGYSASTAAPTNGLQVAGNSILVGTVFAGNAETSGSPATGIVSGTGGSGTNIAGAEFRIRGGASTGSGAGGPITFYTSAAGSAGTGVNAATERMRINSLGEVRIPRKTTTTTDLSLLVGDDLAIATTATRAKLVIGNTSGVSEFIVGQSATNALLFNWTYNATAANAYGVLETYGGNNNLVLQSFGGNVGINTTTIGSRLQVNGNVAIGYSASTAAPTNGLAVNGLVGIGTTSPKSYAALTVNGQLLTFNNLLVNAGNTIKLNAYYNSATVTDKAISAGYAADYFLNNSTGSLLFRSSTTTFAADADITLVNRMEITNAGQLNLNTGSNVSAIVQSGYSLTGSNASSLLDLAGTWNTTGNPTAIKLNITNTASGANSLLMDLQVGGNPEFRVTRTGSVVVNGSTSTYQMHVVGTGSLLALGEESFTTGRQMLFGIDGSGNGEIQSVQQGTSYRNLSINPLGGNVGIATSSPTSTLSVNGSVAKAITTKTATYTLTSSDHTVIFNLNGNATANLPDATTCSGRIYVIKMNRTSTTDTLTVDPNGAQTIDGFATYDLKCQQAITIQSDGSNWRIIGDFAAGVNCL